MSSSSSEESDSSDSELDLLEVDVLELEPAWKALNLILCLEVAPIKALYASFSASFSTFNRNSSESSPSCSSFPSYSWTSWGRKTWGGRGKIGKGKGGRRGIGLGLGGSALLMLEELESLLEVVESWKLQKKSWSFCWQWKIFFSKEEEGVQIQKEWRIKGDLFLFKSPTRVRWKDTTFMKSNVCLPSARNEVRPKWLETSAEATCPVSSTTRHNCLSIEVWYNVTVKDFSNQVPLTVRGLMYSTPAKAYKNANMVGSGP